jgi:hypothetical protein
VARARVDELARKLGAVYLDVRLLVSEIVTASTERLSEGSSMELRIMIFSKLVRVELAHVDSDFVRGWTDMSRAKNWSTMLMETLSARWGTETANGGAVWFEVSLPSAS